jgi:hypothetical protein
LSPGQVPRLKLPRLRMLIVLHKPAALDWQVTLSNLSVTRAAASTRRLRETHHKLINKSGMSRDRGVIETHQAVVSREMRLADSERGAQYAVHKTNSHAFAPSLRPLSPRPCIGSRECTSSETKRTIDRVVLGRVWAAEPGEQLISV